MSSASSQLLVDFTLLPYDKSTSIRYSRAHRVSFISVGKEHRLKTATSCCERRCRHHPVQGNPYGAEQGACAFPTYHLNILNNPPIPPSPFDPPPLVEQQQIHGLQAAKWKGLNPNGSGPLNVAKNNPSPPNNAVFTPFTISIL